MAARVGVFVLASLLLQARSVVFRSTQGSYNSSALVKIAGVGEDNVTQAPAAPGTFRAWYDAHAAGRGVWKWNNALDSYQRHFAAWANKPVSLAEVGVQSGGSILMWKAILGAQCHVFGLDINPACAKFNDPTATITIMDQGDSNAWNNFYAGLTANGAALDILVDDGSHQAHHMSLTLHTSFPNIKPGGYVAVEDIHGRHYVQSFFDPVSQSIGQWHAQNLIASLHLYPFQLVVHKAGAAAGHSYTPGAAAATVADFPQLWPALTANPGGFVNLANAAWGSFLSEPVLKGIFAQFAPLHDYQMTSNPAGCHQTASNICTVAITNSQSQNQIIGVHIFATHLAVEVAAAPPLIAATRRGTEFIAYG